MKIKKTELGDAILHVHVPPEVTDFTLIMLNLKKKPVILIVTTCSINFQMVYCLNKTLKLSN